MEEFDKRAENAGGSDSGPAEGGPGDIGPADTDGPRFVSHRSLASRASSARNWPSRPPANNTFEAVVSTPPSVDGAAYGRSTYAVWFSDPWR